ncbi:sugar ABC transporter substrate-binding protein [Rubrobacter taiwanensis]|uniref:sugar ABC transporter substrate-binding protein n=1 Tax=Rubrobacter taiwanensis TaxID=185139 RepID=UPI001FB36245|nr:sugar ABC transporter substrate-binding protein [Rubrobacter taiwanensis]
MIGKGRWLLAVLAVALFAVAGCGADEQAGEQQGGEGGLADRGDIRIVMVTHGPPADPFWSVVKNGADQAAADLGVEFEYRSPEAFDVVEIQRNLEAAIASEPDGLAVSVPDPDALGPLVQEAVEKGIPVVMLNAGREDWEEFGALTYIGQTEYEAGVAAGERMAGEGVTNALCINHQQGVQTLDQRCSGFEEGLGGTVEQVAVDGNDPTAARSGIQTALRQNPDANGMLTLGPAGANPALQALEGADVGEDFVFGTFDLSPEILQAVADGQVLFAIDQQQFLQGYLPVLYLTQYVQYGLRPVGEVPTGPAFVTQETAEEVIELSRQGIR